MGEGGLTDEVHHGTVVGGWEKLTFVYLAMSDSEGFSWTNSVRGTDSDIRKMLHHLECSPGCDTSMLTLLIYEPNGTESDSSSEHSLPVMILKTGFLICHGKL